MTSPTGIIKNVIILTLAAGFSFAVIFGFIHFRSQDLIAASDGIQRTHETIAELYHLESRIYSLVSNFRRSLLMGEESGFQEKADLSKKEIAEALVYLTRITKDDPEAQPILQSIQTQLMGLVEYLLKNSAIPEQSMSIYRQEIIDIAARQETILSTIDRFIELEEANLKKASDRNDLIKKEYEDNLLIVIGANGAVIALLNILLFISTYRRKQITDSLNHERERSRLALQGTSDGIYDWDIETGKVYYSPQFIEMIGYDQEEFKFNLNDLTSRLHPEDHESVMKFVGDYLKGELKEYNNIFRMIHKTGRIVWIHSRGKAMFNKEGKPVRMVGAHTDITALKVAQEKLAKAKQKAELASEAKSHFLAHMSHEIRTPLNAINGIIKILGREPGMSPDHRHLLKTMEYSAVSLLDLLNDVLDFAKIENNDIQIERKPYHLVELAQQVISIMSVKAREKGISFNFDFSGITEAAQLGDPGKIRQILLNLIGNAVKFTEEGGVKVTLSQSTLETTYTVSDSGIGIAKENISKIFNMFEQGDSSITRRYGGTGLGLAISKKLAEALGGKITVKSQVGQGSTFTLTLPNIARKVSASEKTLSENNPGVVHYLNDLKNSTAQSLPPKILIAEDYEGNVLVLKHIMKALGYGFDIARDGEQAVEMFSKSDYDIVLMDVQMPKMDGIEATKRMRAIEKDTRQGKRPARIIAMTAHALAGDNKRCLEAGMDDYMAKPLDEDELQTKLSLAA